MPRSMRSQGRISSLQARSLSTAGAWKSLPKEEPRERKRRGVVLLVVLEVERDWMKVRAESKVPQSPWQVRFGRARERRCDIAVRRMGWERSRA